MFKLVLIKVEKKDFFAVLLRHFCRKFTNAANHAWWIVVDIGKPRFKKLVIYFTLNVKITSCKSTSISAL